MALNGGTRDMEQILYHFREESDISYFEPRSLTLESETVVRVISSDREV